MKSHFKLFAVLSFVSLTSFASTALRAQDAPPPDQGPPPPQDQGQMDQGAPPPQQDQGAPPDQGAPGQDDQGQSFQNFYDQLSDQGQWVQTDDYGYVFQPNVSDPNWAPYTDGHWVYTDVGWTWVSDEPWGWATYHYGRWANIDGTGWVWVPGYRWAPAWVSWRYGGGYAGWAPLPPDTLIGAEYEEGGIDVSGGFHFGGDVDVSFDIGPGCYNFIRIGDFGERNYRGRYADRGRNFVIINNTTNVTNININNRGGRGNFQGVRANGPLLREVNASSRTHVQTVQLAEASRPGRSQVQGNTLSVFAPRVNAATAQQARPARVAQTIAHPAFNRGNSITQPLAVTSSVRPPAPTESAIQAANTARSHVPSNAHIATGNTAPRTTISAPLNTLSPVINHRTQGAVNPGSATVNPNAVQHNSVQHRDPSDAFTGGGNVTPQTQTHVQPSTTFHPQTQVQPGQTVQPHVQQVPQTQTHVQQEVPHTTQTYHPQTEVPQTHVQQTPTYHQPQVQQTPTYHQPQVQQTQTYHQAQAPQAQTYHPQAQVPQTHTETHTQVPHTETHTEAPHETHAAPAPAATPAPAAQGQPAGGNGQGNHQH